MDNLSKHLAGSPRLLSAFPQVETIGFIRGKRDRVKRAFNSVNFSFILSGRGYYTWNGVRHEVLAPAVLTQWPDAPMDYSPEPEWDEMYLIYPSTQIETLIAAGLFSLERVLWKIERGSEILSMAEDFFERCRNFSGSGPADSLDMSAYALVVESLLAREADNSEPHREEIRAIARQLRSQPENYYDFEKLAAEIGMSLSTFRRYFLRYYPESRIKRTF